MQHPAEAEACEKAARGRLVVVVIVFVVFDVVFVVFDVVVVVIGVLLMLLLLARCPAEAEACGGLFVFA